MTSTSIAPGAFVEIRGPRGFTLVRRDLAAALERTVTSSPDPWTHEWRREGVVGGGRRPLERVAIPEVGVVVVVKRLTRGGVLGSLLRSLAVESRARNEVEVAGRLAGAGVPTVPLLAARAERPSPLLRLARIETLTEHVGGAVDLLTFLSSPRERASRRDVLRRAGAAVAGMHSAGVEHQDLNLRNLLVTAEGGVLLLDFGASRVGDVDSEGRAANLARLLRSAEKWRMFPGAISRTDVLCFLKGYDGASAGEWWRRAGARFSRTIALHRIAWRLFGRPGRPVRSEPAPAS